MKLFDILCIHEIARKVAKPFLFAMAILLIVPSFPTLDAQEAMSPGRKQAPLKYALQLPPHCGFDYFGRTEPQYQRMPKELCGVGTNHFCGALINLMKARDETNAGKKGRLLKKAEKEILYTQRHIANHPRCPLHPEVEAALMEVKAHRQVLEILR